MKRMMLILTIFIFCSVVFSSQVDFKKSNTYDFFSIQKYILSND
jgi:hypothetical protein